MLRTRETFEHTKLWWHYYYGNNRDIKLSSI